MKLAKHHRERLVTKFVADGESWSKSRHAYELTLGLQIRSLSMMANWLGGAVRAPRSQGRQRQSSAARSRPGRRPA